MHGDKFSQLEAQLRQIFEDQRLSKPEKYALQDLAAACVEEERRFLIINFKEAEYAVSNLQTQ